VIDVQYGAPIVAVDPHTGPSSLPTVESDNLRGAQLATEHLIGLGHRRIAMVTGRPDLQSAQLREQGYRQALQSAGIPIDEELLQVGDYQPEASAEATRRLLAAADSPTAIFAANDVAAIAAVAVAGERGLRVPDDLSIVGFDNIPESALCTPSLTTVDQRIRQMGHDALQLLVHLIRGDTVESTHITLATDLVVRQSTGAPA
jgi:LacI family transcriptional regulator